MAKAASQKGGRGRFISVIIVVVLVLGSVGAWFATTTLGKEKNANYVAVVHDGDGGTTVLPLSEDTVRTITTSKGTNIVVIEGGAVHVSEADCPNHDCIQQGTISEPGSQIVCLPHELWIEIVADDGSHGEFDVVGS